MLSFLAFIACWLSYGISSAAAYSLISENSKMLGWEDTNLRVNVNLSGCPRDVDMRAIIQTAMGVWNGVTQPRIELSIGRDSPTSAREAMAGDAVDSPLLICDPEFGATTGESTEVIPGITGVLVNSNNNRVMYGYTLLNAQAGAGANIDDIRGNRIAVIVAHELGHLLGLGHSENPDALMYYEVSNKQRPVLSQDDISGIQFLYFREEDKNAPGMGCGTIHDSFPNDRPPPGVMVFWFSVVSLGLLVLKKSNFRRA